MNNKTKIIITHIPVVVLHIPYHISILTRVQTRL